MPSIDETLGQYSELFILLAAMAYTVAFIAFCWDLATSSKTIRSVESRLAREQSEQKVLAGAGAGTSATGSAGKAGAGASVETADEAMVYTKERRVAARIGVAITIVAALVHAAGVISRAIAAHRVPWGNMYEFCTTGGLVVAVVFLVVLTRKDVRFLGSFVIGLVVIMLCAAAIGFPTPVAHLVPALQSYWLIIHVSIAVIASALFTLTFAMSVLQLLQANREARARAGQPERMGFLRLVPSALSLENFAYRVNAIAFVLWTFTLMAGAIWAEKAWGRYWGWDTKEVWTFVIWVVYAGYLHARATRGWTGTRAAWLSIVGYLCVVFNFTIVNVFFSGLHSYSGIQ
ncbi:c-type cytochrome biogenesis protein CcsB [Crystallibacter degradans]|uniref:c-type cytochrome biogenesis protein CcsB n=1 Tax=Crystallibacter degradans TaxID=2726743 RepID=UPI001475FED2|nr:c-type cytochrome biogenesis protein CcsB [Arthrobacter sp. SF27]NMR29632.1 c-type cytochrome biogenesis protein CcsB [Arthrobacter sp. SF27]